MEEQYDKKYIKELAHKWVAGTLSSDERQQLEIWDKSHADDLLNLEEGSNPDEIFNRLFLKVRAEIANERVPTVSIWKLWTRLAVAAVAIIVIGAGLFYYNLRISEKNHKAVGQYVNDINPGKIGATLTLANGKKISLSNAIEGEVAKEVGIIISKTADGQLIYEIKSAKSNPDQINTLTTAKGETYILTLPDQSKVWMNAASSLTYSAALLYHGIRRVKLQGEAYFQIARDKNHPFIVESKGQQVEVLGTHFNVNSYEEEGLVKTTLLKGSVKISAVGNSKILQPDQQSILKDGTINVQNVDVEEAVAWKDGYFQFSTEPLGSVMRKIANWYNVDVEYQDADLASMTFNGTISKYKTVSQILKKLELTGTVKFNIVERKIVVSKF